MLKRLLPGFLLVVSVPLSAQVTSLGQQGDVRPTDPAFLALQRLVEHNGCITGYPDATYRGNRPLSRYEFAAGLNACADRVRQLTASGQAVDNQDQADLAMLEREFASELATLRGRVGALEERTGKLEKQQFSTTTKLTPPGDFQFGQPGTPPANPRKFQKRKRKQPPVADGSGGN